MRVALLSLAVPIPGKPHIGNYNIAQCQAICDLGHQAEIFTCAPTIPRWAASISTACRRQFLRPKTMKLGDVTINTVRMPLAYTRFIRESCTTMHPGLTQTVFTLAARAPLFRRLDEYQPDTVVIHGIHPWADLATGYASTRQAHLLAIEHSQSDIERVVRTPKLSASYRTRAAAVDRVMTVNARMAGSLQKIGVHHTHVIHNGINRVHLNPEPGEHTDRFTILCAGAYTERKGHRFLIEAFKDADLDHAVLRLVGNPGPEIRTLVQDTRPGKDIEILPEMNHATLRRHMRDADLFALPSWDEAFGLVFAEAISVGTPVLMGDDAGILEIPYVRESAWVVPPRNSRAIRNALEKAAASRGKTVSENLHRARDWITDHLTWEQNARTLLALPSTDARSRQAHG